MPRLTFKIWIWFVSWNGLSQCDLCCQH